MRKIAVSSCFRYPDMKRNVFGPKVLCYIERDMANFCSHGDTMPILIPDVNEDLMGKYLDDCSGLMMQGGDDLSPESYGEEFLDKQRWPGDKYRDDYELKLVAMALERKLPIIGVCRGFQILNTFFGGKLHQDLETTAKTKVEHRHAQDYDHIHHEVDVPGDILKSIYKKDKIMVNSIHHQGIRELGKDLVVEAICKEDNLIEAFTHKDLPIIAFQWHPEFNHTLKDVVEPAGPIFDYFISLMENK